MIKNKKGSHVGVILSFVIFVTFLVFLFSIFGSPLKVPSNKNAVIDYIEAELTKKFEANLTILTIAPPTSAGKSCIKIINAKENFQIANSLAKDVNDNVVKSAPSSGINLFIKWGSEEFFRIYYSEEPLNNQDFSYSDCYLLQPEDISSVRTDVYFSTNKISEFLENYSEDYDAVKEELNLPVTTEFGFSFTDEEGNINSTKQTDANIDIFSRDVPIQYFDEYANVKSGFINIKVW